MSDGYELRQRQNGLSIHGIRIAAMIATAIGTFGITVFQRGMLGITEVSSADLMQILDGENAMTIAAAALICRFIYCCAVPLFAFLLLEGFDHTENFRFYLLRTAGLALVSEIPYNIAFSGKVFDLSSRNPSCVIPFALLLLYLYDYCSKMDWKGKVLDVIVTIAALIWVRILNIGESTCFMLVLIAMRIFKNRPEFRGISGAAAALLCCGSSVYYALSPLTMMAVHFYNGEEGNGKQLFSYLAYPICLIVCAIFTTVV